VNSQRNKILLPVNNASLITTKDLIHLVGVLLNYVSLNSDVTKINIMYEIKAIRHLSNINYSYIYHIIYTIKEEQDLRFSRQ
jgi:hypothetical protein